MIKRTKDDAIEYRYELSDGSGWTPVRTMAKSMSLMRAESVCKTLQDMNENWLLEVENALDLVNKKEN